jgi:hypothetical protein
VDEERRAGLVPGGSSTAMPFNFHPRRERHQDEMVGNDFGVYASQTVRSATDLQAVVTASPVNA